MIVASRGLQTSGDRELLTYSRDSIDTGRLSGKSTTTPRHLMDRRLKPKRSNGSLHRHGRYRCIFHGPFHNRLKGDFRPTPAPSCRILGQLIRSRARMRDRVGCYLLPAVSCSLAGAGTAERETAS